MEILNNFYPNRDSIPEHLTKRGLKGLGAEIGVQRGLFSKKLLSGWPGQKLYLIDTWRYLDNYMDIANCPDLYTNLQCYAQTFSNVYEFGDRVTIIREYSGAASRFFPDQSLDFVYLDADHSYEGVKADIDAWYPKVKPGGVFCGDDFLDGNIPAGIFGVRSAVIEFAKKHNYDIKVTSEGDYPSWIIDL